MEPINWLHLRALTLLALFGVFVMYALLAGSWLQDFDKQLQ